MYLGMAAFGRYRLYHAQYLCLNSCLRTFPKSFLPTSNPSASFPPQTTPFQTTALKHSRIIHVGIKKLKYCILKPWEQTFFWMSKYMKQKSVGFTWLHIIQQKDPGDSQKGEGAIHRSEKNLAFLDYRIKMC